MISLWSEEGVFINCDLKSKLDEIIANSKVFKNEKSEPVLDDLMERAQKRDTILFSRFSSVDTEDNGTPLFELPISSLSFKSLDEFFENFVVPTFNHFYLFFKNFDKNAGNLFGVELSKFPELILNVFVEPYKVLFSSAIICKAISTGLIKYIVVS